jgi:hypothetical protein
VSTSSRRGLHASPGVCSQVGSVAAGAVSARPAAARAARRSNARPSGPDPLLTLFLLQGLAAAVATRRSG